MSANLETPVEPSVLLSVQQLAQRLNCSTRHIYRLVDSGRLPRPLRLGALVRWPQVVIEHWVASGCPRCDGRKGPAP
jgi:excisionase family DNA binding protein